MNDMEMLLAEAGELGATRALQRLGLADEGAAGDVRELRDLLRAWRDAKASAWKAAWSWAGAWVARVALAVVLAGLAMRLGFGDLVR